MIKNLLIALGLVFAVLLPPASGTELKPTTARAFERYVELTEARIHGEVSDPGRFLQFDSLPDAQKAELLSRLRRGEVMIQSMSTKENGAPIEIPGGLVHHWLAIGFIPGASAYQALKLAQDYERFAQLYKPEVQDARVLNREGQHFRIYYRFSRHAIISISYNVQFDVEYFTPDNLRNYSVARALRIAEVENAGKVNEKEYPVGNDHGYMWRLNMYTRCAERDGGVYLQIEFLALSRTVPAVFAWLVNPYIHSVPQDYLKRNLETTRVALAPSGRGPLSRERDSIASIEGPGCMTCKLLKEEKRADLLFEEEGHTDGY